MSVDKKNRVLKRLLDEIEPILTYPPSPNNSHRLFFVRAFGEKAHVVLSTFESLSSYTSQGHWHFLHCEIIAFRTANPVTSSFNFISHVRRSGQNPQIFFNYDFLLN